MKKAPREELAHLYSEPIDPAEIKRRREKSRKETPKETTGNWISSKDLWSRGKQLLDSLNPTPSLHQTEEEWACLRFWDFEGPRNAGSLYGTPAFRERDDTPRMKRVSKQLEKSYSQAFGWDLLGVSLFYERTIVTNGTKQSLAHELFHAVNSAFCLSQPGNRFSVPESEVAAEMFAYLACGKTETEAYDMSLAHFRGKADLYVSRRTNWERGYLRKERVLERVRMISERLLSQEEVPNRKEA